MLAQLAADGVTLMMATHDLGQARRLARHVLFLNRGGLAESGPAADFFSAPRTEAARAFLAGDLLW
jgi:tungstate transport system ATP-binding protein